MASTTLPRPSRPSMGPPNTPLPSLPIAKTRSSGNSTPTTPATAPRNSLLPAPLSTSRSVSSALPTRSPSNTLFPKTAPTSPLPDLPNGSRGSATIPASTVQSIKSARKVVSIGSFPAPPKGTPKPGDQSPPSSAGSPTAAPTPVQRHSFGARTSSLKATGAGTKRKLRSSTASQMTPRQSYSSNTHSLLSGGGDSRSVSLMNLPSPPSSEVESGNDVEGERGRETTAAADKIEHGKDGKGNVIVSVRVRPEVGESDAGDLEWMVDGRRQSIAFRGKEGGEYTYDNVFTAHDNNYKVYESAGKRLVRRVMEGYHGTVFAYGMTGTGKTFSMQGTATSPGVIPLAITDIFSYIRETPHREFLLRVSYLEIYNEKINDLLSPPQLGANGQALPQEEIKLREDSKRGVYATPLKEEIVQSPTQLLRVIARGDNARRVAGTQFNARSSRSHAVVQIVVESRERAPPSADSKRAAILPGGVRVSTLSLIDLAGSERAAESKERRTEGAHINKSLLTLGTVISKLSSTKDTDKTDGDKHLPYRDSKLTRLLQPALAGNSLISILCTIQIGSNGSVSGQNHTMETLNTMKFASRAKNNIVSRAKKAEEAFAGDAGSRALMDHYRNEIADLRKQLEAKNSETTDGSTGKINEKEDEAERAREREHEQRQGETLVEIQLARTALRERIEHLNRLILSSKSLGVNAGRSFSALSMARTSAYTMTPGGAMTDDARSTRSSTATLQAHSLMNRNSSAGSIRSFRQSNGIAPLETPDEEMEEMDFCGENGDGNASKDAQIRALQADLSDKNRYISTLERRLLQARRSSQSRTSMSFATRASLASDGADGANSGFEQLLREKDSEISELRARLEDKERMVTALRSATRTRDIANLTVDTSIAKQRRSNGLDSASSSIKSGVIASAPPSTSLRSPLYGINGGGNARASVRNSARNSSNLASARNSTRNSATANNLNGVISGAVTAPSSARNSGQPLARTTSEGNVHTNEHVKTETKPAAILRRNSSSAKTAAAAAMTNGSNNKSNGSNSVDEMKKLLDEMITEHVQQNGSPNATRKSLASPPMSPRLAQTTIAIAASVITPASPPPPTVAASAALLRMSAESRRSDGGLVAMLGGPVGGIASTQSAIDRLALEMKSATVKDTTPSSQDRVDSGIVVERNSGSEQGKPSAKSVSQIPT